MAWAGLRIGKTGRQAVELAGVEERGKGRADESLPQKSFWKISREY